MIQKVAVIGKDKRKLLSAAKLSAAEKKQIRSTTGFVFCPGSGPQDRSFTSAALVGDGSHLITTAHTFIDPETGKRREPLSQCYFQAQDKPTPPKIFLEIPDDGKSGLLVGTNFPQSRGDFAVVKLKSKPPGVTPFPLDLSMKPVKPNTPTITISAVQDGIDNKKYSEPIYQECPIRDVTLADTSQLLSSCDSTPGSSGSIQLVRNENGQLVLKGMIVGGDPKDHEDEYNFTERHYTYANGIDGEFLADILASDHSIKSGSGAL